MLQLRSFFALVLALAGTGISAPSRADDQTRGDVTESRLFEAHSWVPSGSGDGVFGGSGIVFGAGGSASPVRGSRRGGRRPNAGRPKGTKNGEGKRAKGVVGRKNKMRTPKEPKASSISVGRKMGPPKKPKASSSSATSSLASPTHEGWGGRRFNAGRPMGAKTGDGKGSGAKGGGRKKRPPKKPKSPSSSALLPTQDGPAGSQTGVTPHADHDQIFPFWKFPWPHAFDD